ncbi:hypothetical protein PMAYCL1PPCAC_01205, partial [Pristionchus mayeri]
QVSSGFRSRINEFMKRKANRPELMSVQLYTTEDGQQFELLLFLYASYIPFYGLTNQQMDRLQRFLYSIPYLRVTLNGLDDPIIEQMIDLLSSKVKKVSLYGERVDGDYPLYWKLLSASNIDHVEFIYEHHTLDDTTAPFITSIASRARSFSLRLDGPVTQLTDPASFIHGLYSTYLSRVQLSNRGHSDFFGLPRNFWKKFFNENLANGSLSMVSTDNMRAEEAPVELPDSINRMVWEKKK